MVETLDRHMNLDSGWNFIKQGGPLPVENRFITPISAVITIYKAIYTGYNSIYNWWKPTLYLHKTPNT